MARERNSGKEEISEDESTFVARRDWLKATGAGAAAAISGLSLGAGSVTASTEGGPMNPEDWQLVFEDQFEGNSLNTDNWGVGFGWGPVADGDDATARSENVVVDDGTLRLIIESEGTGSNGCYQGAIHSRNKQTWGPGTYVEARCQLPFRYGLLPAFWGKPNSEAWPPEIDIVELFSHEEHNRNPGRAAHTVHWAQSGEVNDMSSGYDEDTIRWDTGYDLSNGFHTYGCAWHEDRLEFYFDGELVGTVDDSLGVDAQNAGAPFYLMFTCHVNRWGTANLSESWQEEMLVDYCRVWEYAPGSGSSPTEDEVQEEPEEESNESEQDAEGVLVDDCIDLGQLHSSSDTGSLFVDTSNSQYFKRNDDNCSDDSSRIVRAGTTNDVSMIYEPGGPITEFRVEGHDHQSSGGSFSFSVSTDGGESWTQVSPDETQYCGTHADWRHVEYSGNSLPAGTDQLRIDLTGGSASWSGQIGHVEIGYGGSNDETDEGNLDDETDGDSSVDDSNNDGEDGEEADDGVSDDESRNFPPNSITFIGTGTPAQYRFSVTGRLTRNPNRGTLEGDEIDRKTASGRVTNPDDVDSFRFSGRLTDIEFTEGDARVIVNGVETNLDQIARILRGGKR